MRGTGLAQLYRGKDVILQQRPSATAYLPLIGVEDYPSRLTFRLGLCPFLAVTRPSAPTVCRSPSADETKPAKPDAEIDVVATNQG
jgi:hypothetical protein